MNRLPEVRQFIYEDIPLFHDVEFVRKPGEPPFLHLLNASGQRVETVDLSVLNREQCNQELTKRGFYRKTTVDEQVPEEFKNKEYRSADEL